MNTTIFTVPGKPTGWKRPEQSGKRRYTHPAHQAYMDTIAMFALEAGLKPTLTICHLDVLWRTRRGEEELVVTVVQTDDLPPPGPKLPDGDNVLKITADALGGSKNGAKIAWEDDAQVSWWSLHKEQ